MNRFRDALREHRILVLTLVALNLYGMVEGHNFVYAHEVRQQEQDRHLREFASLFGIPVEKLRGRREMVRDPLEPVEDLVRGALDWIELPLSYFGAMAHQASGEDQPAAAAAQEPSAPAPSPPREFDARLLERLERAGESSDKTRTREAHSLKKESLPLRRVEKVARTAKPTAVAPAVAEPTVPQPRKALPKAAPELVALAQSLGNSPGRIFRLVHDEIDYDPKWGAGKSPLGTLHERRGTSWEQAWLLQQLLTAAGVDARFEWGEVEITTAKLVNLTGVADAFRAGDLLTTAGVPIVLLVDGSQVVGARMSHVWVRAFLDYIPRRGATPGPGDTWIRMDPSLKRFDVGAGVRLDEEVPFDLGEYLQSGTLLSPRAYYEDALAAYADAHNLGVAGLEGLKPAKSLIQEAFPFVPASLRAKILSVAGEATDVPAAFRQQLDLQVREAGGAVLLTWSTLWPAVYGRRVELAWPGATSADQSALDLNGGVFATPPFEVDLRPVLRVDGTDVALGEEVGSAEDVELLATLSAPQGSPTVVRFEIFAGEHAVFTADSGQIPQETVDRYTAGRDAATNPEEVEAWALALAGAVYLRSLSRDLEHLSALRYRRLIQLGNVVLAVQRGAVSRSPDGTPLTFSAAPPSLDLGAMVLGLFPADGVAGPAATSVATLELLGSQGSAREGESLTQALGGEHLTAVGFLTRAVREGQTLTRVDATNVEPALAASELSSDAEASVRAGVDRGLIAWISETQLPFDTWDATGYVLEDPSTGAGGYLETYERLVQGLEANIVFHSPQDLDEVTAPIDVVATLEGEKIESWTLAYQMEGEDQAVVLATGVGPATNQTLAQLDPTLLLNGLYDIVLTGRDTTGQSVTKKVSVVVEGNMKIGHFSLSFVDLRVPVLGLGIEIIRTYDSRERQQRDFGIGWRLDIRQGSVRHNRTPGDGWQFQTGFLPCDTVLQSKSHLTVVRLSDQEIYRFALKLADGAATLGGCFGTAHFDFVDGPLPGATLDILGQNEVFYENGADWVIDVDTFEVYEPENVRLTTRDGRIFELNLADGVTLLEDLNGNQLSITTAGITHSSSRGIAFDRDAEGRIIGISDPLERTMSYAYDAAGDLVSFTDRAGAMTRFTYDGDHRLLDIVDPRGVKPIRNEYDADGRVVRHIDAFGKVTEFGHDRVNNREVVTNRLGASQALEYDSRGNIVRETDELDNVTTRTFDFRDNLLSNTDPLGRTTTYTYTAKNDLATLADPLGNTTTYTYNDRGQLLMVTDPRGKVTTNVYDSRGNLTSTTDALGSVTAFSYDAGGKLVRTTDALGSISSFQYDAFGNLTRETDALGHEMAWTYDGNGNRLTELRTRTLPDASTESLLTSFGYDDLDRLIAITTADGSITSVTYDLLGKVTQRTDVLGRITTLTYDPMGNLISTTYPAGTVETRSYDDEGRPASQVDRAGRTTVFAHDAAGRLSTATFPDGATTSNLYDAAGQLAAITNARGNTTTFAYDAASRRVAVIDPSGNGATFAYDAEGNRTAVTDTRGHVTTFAYDPLNRLTTTVHPDATTTIVAYDSLGRRIAETDQAGVTTEFLYDPLGRLTAVKDGLGHTTSYTYDELGNRLTQTDSNGHTTRFEYDRLGRQTARVLPDGSRESMTYNADGTLTSHTAFNGATRRFEYDAEQRLTRRVYPDGSDVSFTFTASGQRASMTDSRGTTTYTYDVRDRLIEKTDPSGYKLGYTYDSQGNRTSLTASVGAEVYTTTYTYEALNRLATVTDSQGGVTALSYDLEGNRSKLVHANGFTTYYTYDSLNRLTELSTKNAIGDVLSSYAYTLDSMGNRIRIEEHDGISRHYAYDHLYRLTQDRVTDPADALVYRRDLAYDPVGNRLHQTVEEGSELIVVSSAYDDRDRLLTAGTVSYGWDNNGDLTSRTEDAATTFNWDFENQLTSVELANGTVAESTYDADGNRVRTAVTRPGEETVAVDYLVDTAGPLSHVVADVAAGAVQTIYTRANDDLIGLFRPGSNLSRQYHADGLGSIRLLSDKAGTVSDRYSFTAFGELTEHVGPDTQPYLFAGERIDPAVRLYDVRARWLDTADGRFVSVDPLKGTAQQPMSQHVYSYALQNPVNLTDPTGLFAGVVVVGLIAVVVSIVIAGNIPPISPGVPIESIPANSISHRGRLFIIGWEAWVDHLYNDAAGHCTVGFGSLVHFGNCTFARGNIAEAPYLRGITVGQGLALLDQDIQAEAYAPIRNLISVALNQHEFDAVASLLFNVGQTNFRASQTRRLINEGRHRRKANPGPLEGHWNGFIYAGGVVQNGLVTRRAQEWNIFQNAEYEFRPWNIPSFP